MKRWLVAGAALAVLIAAAALRLRGIFNDLWLDEIWSLNLVSEISSPWAVFTGIHFDNNQYLNSLFLYGLGSHVDLHAYRVPSVMFGTGSVALAWLIGRRRSLACAFFALVLVGFSYVMVLYSSEARGYAGLVFFSFLAFHGLELHLEKPRWALAALVAFSEVMGFLSHLTFVYFLAAAIVWSGWRSTRFSPGPRRMVLACHVPPVLVLGWLYVVDLRMMTLGGGTEVSAPRVYAESLAWIVGFPSVVPVPLMALAVLAFFGAGVWVLGREGSGLTLFFGGVMACPLLMIALKHTDFLYVRYFLVTMAFSLILISALLARLFETGSAGKVVSVVFLAGYVLANGRHVISLFEDGRGHYQEAIRYIGEHTERPAITVGSDHDFRIPIVLQFYAPRVLGDRQLEYEPSDSWPKEGPEWVIHHQEPSVHPRPPPAQFSDAAGNRYELARTFPTAPLSGLHWFVYHAAPR